jgi:hypothetical protein
MSLYGYGLAQYVVETGHGVPTCGVDCVGTQSVWLEKCGFGCSQHPKAQEGALGGLVITNTFGEISVGTLQARGSH